MHFGELVEADRPKKRHYDLRRLIRDTLAQKLSCTRWVVDIEMPYGLSADYDVRAADIGVVLRKTWDEVPEDSYLIDSPELIVH